MTRRLRASPATRAAVHHDPRPKEYCPRHGPAYPATGCEQCAYEKAFPGYVAPSASWTEFWRTKVPGIVCQVTLGGRIAAVAPDESVVVWVQVPCRTDPVLMVLPKRAVTPLVEVKS